MAQAEDRVRKSPQERGTPEIHHLGEEKLAQILVFSPYAISMTDLQGTILECNPAGHRLHGFEPGELIGKPCLDLVAPEDRDRALQGMKQTLEQEVVHHVELTMLTKDGRAFPADLSARVIRDAQGRPTNFVTIIHDITERKQALEAIRRNEALLEQSQALANIGYFYYAPASGDLYWSDHLYRIYGLEPGTPPPTARQHAALMLEGEGNHLHRLIEQTRLTGEPFELEHQIRRTDGQVRTLHAIARWNRDDKGRLQSMLGTVQDITDRREAEQRLLDYQQRLRSLASELSLSEERQRHQIASLLHDGACQHLALLKMQIQGLCNEMEPAKRKPFEAICDGLTTTMEALRNMTLDLSPPTLYVAGLEAAIESLLEDQIQTKHGLRYTLEVDPEAVPKADDLRVLVFQSVRELLINVVKHAKATHVRVTIKRHGSEGQVIVADNGKGFDVGAVEASISKSGGFGLFSIRERLEFIGGQLHIQSKRGRGSRLTLIIPLDGQPGVPAKA